MRLIADDHDVEPASGEAIVEPSRRPGPRRSHPGWSAPLIKRLQKHAVPDGICLLLTGQSTPHHFSAVVTARLDAQGGTVECRRRRSVPGAGRHPGGDVPRPARLQRAERCRDPGASPGRATSSARAGSSFRPRILRPSRFPRPAAGVEGPGPGPDRADGRTQRMLYRWRWSPTTSPPRCALVSSLIARFSRREQLSSVALEPSRLDILKNQDPEIFNSIVSEERRQRDELELIASENYTSAAVMEAVGSVLTNKYAGRLAGLVATTAVASTSTRSSGWRSTASRRSSARITPTSSRTRVPRRIRRSITRRWRSATPSWRWTWPRGHLDARDEAQLLGALVSDRRLRRRSRRPSGSTSTGSLRSHVSISPS